MIFYETLYLKPKVKKKVKKMGNFFYNDDDVRQDNLWT